MRRPEARHLSPVSLEGKAAGLRSRLRCGCRAAGRTDPHPYPLLQRWGKLSSQRCCKTEKGQNVPYLLTLEEFLA